MVGGDRRRCRGRRVVGLDEVRREMLLRLVGVIGSDERGERCPIRGWVVLFFGLFHWVHASLRIWSNLPTCSRPAQKTVKQRKQKQKQMRNKNKQNPKTKLLKKPQWMGGASRGGVQSEW